MNLQKFIRNHVEYRIDPLTSGQSRINPKRAKRAKQTETTSNRGESSVDQKPNAYFVLIK
jgi:hypothetical protein